MELRDVLRDLVTTTAGIDFDCIAISSEDRGQGQRIYMEAYTSDKNLVMRAVTKEDVSEVVGRFGIGNLGMLQGLLNLNVYKSDSTKISVNAKDGVVKSLSFTSDDANTNYLVVAEKFIPPQPRFTDQPYDVQVTPSASKVNELKSFSGVFKSFTAHVTPYTEDNSLYFYVGEKNKNNHTGTLLFSKTDGDLTQGYGYPIERVLQALNRVNNAEQKSLGITKTGMLNVTVDTGIAVYSIYVSGC
ncbi:hypothetical protein pEaSNUABM50_00259 [Erwinia phage pEa_SNUABM_50]|uniref:Uncharacterized protein n=4 Tax=Eneladusvirus BF TaxID=2560751 RepID=A0A7L8ZMN8_9CAUD|nr:hypothetical protein FDH34_gp263 [Serratia phage BF]QOI71200.1 hypothetical protein pEaSNUABM12_00262 [Erwinia phage pEa_SNUABM_12]QOI71744.1 hypothetical protein pEaSNUABM47_00260 [Erwinia phage pEa_SNUABM_47]QOI72283.1 hypothetical protein pEaSNUABM50_00259 [Erwinia phage pEa_SNUABM_50]QXO11409.1 hypothetical protein pEaSNUABM19_00263 [Erwinia phage pEa_SNUABM_19]QXO11957.1 hypothetical protein pEaSNUABM44_00261 [Erwinia phage pEa_SNUABM_44]QXO12510.1 hypothetical protein pEaSNUABM49_002